MATSKQNEVVKTRLQQRQQRLGNINPANNARSKSKRFKWTGFSHKTLWDWLQLLAALAISVVVAFLPIYFGIQQTHLADLQHANDLKIAQGNRQNDIQLANDQQEEATLKTYLDDISDLLLNHNLRTSKPGDEVRQVARERTLTVLRRLKADRNKTVLQFLRDANLIGLSNAVIDLSGADLSGDDLRGVNLNSLDLSVDKLVNTNLSGAYIGDTNLSDAYSKGANLSGVYMEKSKLERCS